MTELEQLIATVTGEVKTLLADFKTEFEKEYAERDNEALAALEKRLEETSETLAKLKEKDEATYSLPGSEPVGDEKKDFNYGRAALAICQKNWDVAPLEKEIFDEMAKKRDLSTGQGSTGSYIVPIQQSGDIIDRLRAEVIVEQLGATVYDGGRGLPLYLPRLKSSITAQWIAENGQIPSTDVAFDQIELRPRELAAISKLSMKLVENSAPTADAVVRNDFVRQFALAVDLAALNGSGNQQPVGVIQTGGVQTYDYATNAPANKLSYSKVVAHMFKLITANAETGNPGWAMHPNIAERMQNVGSDAGTGEGGSDLELTRKMFTEAPMERLLGRNFKTTTQMPNVGTGSLIYGNWADLIIAYWKRLELRASDTAGTAFESNQLWLRGITSLDTAVRHPESFVVATNITAN